jgi:prefoldin subunit 5
MAIHVYVGGGSSNGKKTKDAREDTSLLDRARSDLKTCYDNLQRFNSANKTAERSVDNATSLISKAMGELLKAKDTMNIDG